MDNPERENADAVLKAEGSSQCAVCGEHNDNHRGPRPGHAFKENSETGESPSSPANNTGGQGETGTKISPGAIRTVTSRIASRKEHKTSGD